jgi:hypothetical protein
MQLTGLCQVLKGVVRLDAPRAAELQTALEHTKWNLWYGKVKRNLKWLRRIEHRMWHFTSRYAKFVALTRAVHGFQRYVRRNAQLIPNYAQHRRAGQAISTAFVESLVNSLLSKRFAKKQSVQWLPEGAHVLLQTRTRTLNGDLAATFRRWDSALPPRTSPLTTSCSLPDRPWFVMPSCDRPAVSLALHHGALLITYHDQVDTLIARSTYALY